MKTTKNVVIVQGISILGSVNKVFMIELSSSFCYIPTRKISSNDISKKHTGISQRRYAQTCEAASDMGTKAILPLFENKGELKNKINALLTATTSGDYPSPATAHFIHRELELNNDVLCFDVASSCSSFLSAVCASFGLLNSNLYTIVIAAEVKHKGLDPNDFRTNSLFGDGSGGILLKKTNKKNSKLVILHKEVNSKLANYICTPVGGSREPTTLENIHKNKLCILEPKFMFIHTVKSIVSAIEKCFLQFEKNFHKKSCNFIFIHQANKNILLAVKEKLEKNIANKIPLLISDIGNTACASLPILRARFNFLRSLIHFLGKTIRRDEFIEIFLDVCKINKKFSYKQTLTGLIFTAQWLNENVVIVEDGVFSLEECWVMSIHEQEFNDVIGIIYHEKKSYKSKNYLDLWIVAGGGFQTIGVGHQC